MGVDCRDYAGGETVAGLSRVKVTTSCSGRFHIFDQARELDRYGVLHRLINDYPKWVTRRWGIPDDKTVSLLTNGLLGRLARVTSRCLSARQQSILVRRHHDWFSRRIARHLPPDSDIFIGLSSFCLEALRHARREGMMAIVDHGSLHMKTERRLLIEECERWGFPLAQELPPDWLVDKEDSEFREADDIFVLSQAAKRSIVENGVQGEKIFINPCGVDLSIFHKGEKRDRVFRVIQCGGIHPRKGVHYLVRAFTELKLPNSELWFVGGGIEHSVLRPFIERYRADNIRFLGAVPQVELPEIYGQGSIFVLASLADGFGMVVPQAMACGLPVIVTENVGAADIVQDGRTGYVVPIRDVESLKQKLLLLYEDQSWLECMGEMAHAQAHECLGWDAYGKRQVDYLRSRSQNRAGISAAKQPKPLNG